MPVWEITLPAGVVGVIDAMLFFWIWRQQCGYGVDPFGFNRREQKIIKWGGMLVIGLIGGALLYVWFGLPHP